MSDTQAPAASAQPQAQAQAQESTESQTENVADAPEGEDQPKGEPQAPAAVQKMLKKYKLKVDGEEFEEEIDLNDEETMRKHLQLSKAAKKRMGEALEAKRKAIEIVKAFESDPKTMLQRLGPKGREIAEQYLLEQIQDQMLSPEEKELRDLRKLKADHERAEATAKEKAEKAAQEEQVKKHRAHFEKIFVDALKKTRLPKSDRIVRDMAELQYKSLELGIELTAEDLAQELEERELSKIKASLNSSEGDQLLALLGDDVANKIRKSDIARIKAKQSELFSKQPERKTDSIVPKEGKDYMTVDEWKASVDARIKG